jgi:succinate dehydrogenase / fumarate reductase iron-sulfur subunit
VLEGILQARDKFDGSIGIRCSCRQAICGSCGVRVNGEPSLACHTHLDAAKASARDGVIEIEPMGNMPVIKDLIVDMDAVHWKKVQRVTPWLIAKQPVPEREYIVPHENMVDVTQTMGCIQCGACVSDCLAMEVDPGFIGPAALAKAYRFVGDPRDDQQFERLNDLAQDPQGIFDCTHCFKCVDACPKDVNPMGQIMRLRRIATNDHQIVDQNNGERHEAALTGLVRDYGLLHEAELIPRSYGGNSWFAKFTPAAGKELLASLPVIIRGLMRGKLNPKIAIFGHKIPKPDLQAVQAIFDKVEGREQRFELNLYIAGEDEVEIEPAAAAALTAPSTANGGAEPEAATPPSSEGSEQ